jgi:D-amino-acid oxidase
MRRRAFVRSGVIASAGVLSGCRTALERTNTASPRRVDLTPVDVSFDRIIRTTVGLRPYRESGFVVRGESLGDKLLIHNYGHGGAGMSLSWGTAHLAADIAVTRTERRAAVIGCGVAGLTTARVLQRRGFDVTIYAKALPPDTTSNMSWAAFTPMSGLISFDRRTQEWDAQFQKAVQIAYRELQLLAGRGLGVSWVSEYSPTDNVVAVGAGGALEAGRGESERTVPLLPASVTVGRSVLQPGEHPFATRYARRRPSLRFDPTIYLDTLMRDVLLFGGRIVVRTFAIPADLLALEEPVIVNCTGLGAHQLFGDTELVPIKGQLVVLVPQPEIDYIVGGMLPRTDGIVLGHTMERNVWTLDVNESERTRVVDQAIRLFGSMQRFSGAGEVAAVPDATPAVESFFDRES